MPNSPNLPDNANVVAPAPVFYGVAFILGLAVNYFYSIPVIANGYALKVGILLILMSIPIVLSAVHELRKAGTVFDAVRHLQR